jgi:DNA-binding winged helix-turn-helix (wHTH) protein/TolB-like protein/Tfp pilus assembly protein PilF
MEVVEERRVRYEFGRFVLDPVERTFYIEGSPVHLPAKEFETLLLLVENNGHALSKDEMMAAVWQDAFVEESNLAKQISRLRKLLGSGNEDYIETIPKHGYRFNAQVAAVQMPAESLTILQRHTVKRLTVSVEDESSAEPPALPSGSGTFLTLPRIALAALVLSVGIVAAWFYMTSSAVPKTSTIAVLPLRSLNGDQDAKILGLGLTDALITKLGSLRKVIVLPTNAVASYSDRSDPLDMGRRLNVDAVLDGTIQQSEGRLRVNVRLIRTSNGEQLWTDRFEQPIAGLFALQDTLSASIAKSLAFELSKSEAEKLIRRGTQNPDAYEKYLRGRFYQTQNTPEGFDRSLEFYQQAVALDPGFAEAYAGIADANILKFNFGMTKADEVIPDARQATNRALQLDPKLSNAHTSLALIQFLVDHSWPDAESSLQRAIELDPNNADAHHRYAYFLLRLGRFDESLQKAAKALELNPLSPIVQSNIGMTYLFAHRYPEAIEQLEKTASENPQFAFTICMLAESYDAKCDADKAFAVNLKAIEVEGGKSGAELASRLRRVEQNEGLYGAYRVWFEDTRELKLQQSRSIPSFEVALRAATIKDREQTLFWLERSVEEGDTRIGGLKYLAKFDFVRDDPQFQDIFDKLPF